MPSRHVHIRLLALVLILGLFAERGASAARAPVMALSPDATWLFWVDGQEIRFGRLDAARERVGVSGAVRLPEGYEAVGGRTACWTPDGRAVLIVLARGCESSLWRFAAGKWTQLAESTAAMTGLIWRPESRWFIFESWYHARPELFFGEIVDERVQWVNLTNSPGAESGASLDARGRRMLYVSRSFRGEAELVLFDWRSFRSATVWGEVPDPGICSLAPGGRRALVQDGRGLWMLSFGSDLQREDVRRVDWLAGLAGEIDHYATDFRYHFEIAGVAWAGERPVILLPGGGVFRLTGDRWRQYPGSGRICGETGRHAQLATRGRRVLLIDLPAGQQGARAPSVVTWEDDEAAPFLYRGGVEIRLPPPPPPDVRATRRRLKALARALDRGRRAEVAEALTHVLLYEEREKVLVALDLLSVTEDAPPWQRRLEAAVAFWLGLGAEAEDMRTDRGRRLLLAAVNRIAGAGNYAAVADWQPLFQIVDLPGSRERRAMHRPRHWLMLRFGFGALTVPKARRGEALTALEACLKYPRPDRTRTLLVVRAAVAALDAARRHDQATTLVLQHLVGPDGYREGELAELGLSDWFAAVPDEVVAQAKLGHLSPWLDQRLRAVGERLVELGEGPRRDRRLVAMLAAWSPAHVQESIDAAEREGDRIGILVGNMILASYHHHQGRVRQAAGHYLKVCALIETGFACDMISMLREKGAMARHRLWRWLDCEQAARTGPWRPAGPTLAWTDMLRGLPSTYGRFTADFDKRFSVARRRTGGVEAFQQFVSYYPETEAADAARMRLAELERDRAGCLWLWETVAQRPESDLYELALVRAALCAKSAHNCGPLRHVLGEIVDHWRFRNRRKLIGRTLEGLPAAASK